MEKKEEEETTEKSNIEKEEEAEVEEEEAPPPLTGYCFGCKSNQPFKNPVYVESNKRTRISGNCSKCNRGLSTFISTKKKPSVALEPDQL